MTTRSQVTCLRFYMHENRRHHGILLYEWLLERARKMGIHGGTAWRAIAGFGRHGILHEQRFLEPAGDLTIRLDFVIMSDQADGMLALLEAEGLAIFHMEFPAAFGVSGTGT